jgi:hypothetical protein
MSELKSWYFTLSTDQGGPGCVQVEALGYDDARRKMVAEYGIKWAFQYGSLEEVHPFDSLIIEVVE